MIAEGVIAMIWAAAAMTFFGGTEQLAAAGSPGVVVNNISTTLLGSIGGALAILGVVACPITSGDSAFRSARLGIADAFKLNQSSLINRFIIASPLFTVAVMLTFVDFNIIWRYFAWSNQVIATITLWTGAMYLVRHGRFHWIATLPATFMTSVVTTYIIIAPEGLQMNTDIGYPAGFLTAAIAFGLFIHSLPKARKAGEVLPESI
jgi:carbon starvation protein CstA